MGYFKLPKAPRFKSKFPKEGVPFPAPDFDTYTVSIDALKKCYNSLKHNGEVKKTFTFKHYPSLTLPSSFNQWSHEKFGLTCCGCRKPICLACGACETSDCKAFSKDCEAKQNYAKYELTKQLPDDLNTAEVISHIHKTGILPPEIHNDYWLKQSKQVKPPLPSCVICRFNDKYIKPISHSPKSPLTATDVLNLKKYPITIDEPKKAEVEAPMPTSPYWVDKYSKVKIRRPKSNAFLKKIEKSISKMTKVSDENEIYFSYAVIDEKRFLKLIALNGKVKTVEVSGIQLIPIPTVKNKPYLRLIATGNSYLRYYKHRKESKKNRKKRVSRNFEMPKKLL